MINNIYFSPNLKFKSVKLSSNETFNNSIVNLSADTFVKSDVSKVRKTTESSICKLKPLSLSFCGTNTTKSVLDKLNGQLMDVSSEEIESVVNEYPREDKKLVLNILKRATQFGNLDSLNGIYDSLMIEKEKKYNCFSFYEPRINSLIENLTYLRSKKAFPSDPSEPVDLDFICYKKRGALLLDNTMLSKLQNNKDLRNQVSKNDYKLLYPEGWNSGVTAFNLTTLDGIKEKTAKIYSLTKELQIKNNLPQDEAISEALNLQMKDELEKLGLQDKLVIIRNNRVDFNKEPSIDDIKNQLASRKLDLARLESVLPDREGMKMAALDVLDNDARIVSMRELGLKSEAIHSRILEIAKDKNITEDQIFYLIPTINKSFGLIALQYQQVNNIPETQFILDKDSLKTDRRPKLLVILDDYVGTGDSLKDVRYFLRKRYEGELIIAPCIATSMGAKFVRTVVSDDKKCTFLPSEELTSYFQSPEYLNKDEKMSYYNLMEKTGWGNTQANIVFPYMSPDNNTSFFAENIAANYTFNSAGVKPSDNGDTFLMELD